MIRIFKTGLSSSSDSPEGLTAELGQQTSPGRRGFGPKSSGHRSPGGGASILANKRFTLPFLALLAVLTAGLLFLLPGGPLHAQEATTELEYAENGTDPVATFTAVDPEGRMIYWKVLEALPTPLPEVDGAELTEEDIADEDNFSISMDGVLSFNFPPDFERMMGGGTDNNSNTYNLVVVSSDDAPGATTDGESPADNGSNLPQMAYHKVSVTVTDMDEDGSISLSGQQPQVGVALMATLTDPDARSVVANPIINSTWKWEQSPAMDGPWTLIPGAGVGDTDANNSNTPFVKASDAYLPAKDIAGMYLRVTVTYTDKHGDDKTAMDVSAHMVRVEPAGTNATPVFPSSAANREVDENSPPDTAVGKPVKAGDAGDILTYTLTGTDNDGLYRIHRATGQIMVGPRTMLNRESLSSPFQHTVTVTATDPWGITDTGATMSAFEQRVTITINNVNEAPRFTVGPTTDEQGEDEDTNPNNAAVIDIPTLAYAVTDADNADIIKWSLMGADKDAFEIEEDGTTTPSTATSSAMVMFKKSPNFEMPTDANMDNMYMVTVVATDTKKLTAMRDVVITVKNVNDDGKITFSSVQPKVGIPFTATLTDEDGVVAETVKWQWYNSDPDDDGTFGIDDTATPIAKAKSDTYTPKRADLDFDGDGNTNDPVTLHVWATYTDSIGSTSATNMAVNMVEVNQENRAPEFKLNDKVITATTRMVAENTDALSADDADADVATDNIMAPGTDRTRDPVTATDLSGTNDDTLTYTLGGRDEALFRVRSDTGHIEVGAGTKLDYERKRSYMVTVTATDPSLASATIDVTINVTDVNEPPEIAGEDDLTKEFRENSTGTIETFRATDPERRPVYWSLKGNDGVYTDDDLFTISSSGALSFREGRDFEAPGGGADDDSNTYKVIVIASDDAPDIGDANTEAANPSERKFTVLVTNAVERGSVTVDRRHPQVGVSVTATLMDGDATADQITAATWQWYKGSDAISGETRATYSSPADSGSHKVEATYTAKGDTRTVSSTTISIRNAPDPNAGPTFRNAAEARSVDEGKANANVGAPIVATDSDSVDSGKLTYTVSPDTDFSITNNGQLKTKVALDFEDPPELRLTVTATDPSGASGTNNPVTVTVTVNNVNEAPMITQGPTRASNWSEDKDISDPVAVYTASDPETTEAAELMWSLSGPDASDFNIGNQVVDGTPGTPGTLTFKEKPDYEMPAASNNLYRVTVEVSDGKLKATRPMTVMVTDAEEDGKVTLSSVQPKVAIDLTASLKDSDGDVENIEWQWARTATGDGDSPVTDCSTVDEETGWADIDEAEMATYTTDDDDLGKCLQVTASYTDRRGDGKTAMGVSNNAVIVNTDNRAPEFKDQPSSLTIAENSDAGIAVGNMEKIQADDPNDDNLTYKLTGDAALFRISQDDGDTAEVDEAGEITVKTVDTLDYEAKKTYMVTVTATDPNGLSASHDVTIKVTDVDEAPEIIVGGLVVTGTSDINYAENGMGMVATYSAAGPDAAGATWSLSGADAGAFSISSAGVLTFMAPPNYESPADANTDNIYMVMVNANDGTNNAMKTVSVRVTNEDEPGRVTFWRDGADATNAAIMVGNELGGAVDDSDGNPGDTFPIGMYTRITAGNITSWQWARSMDMTDWEDIGTGGMYTVMDDDAGYYLRATATYTDGEGSGKSEDAVTANAVGAVTARLPGDTNNDGMIDKPEVIAAFRAYVADPSDKAEIIAIFRQYVADSARSQ